MRPIDGDALLEKVADLFPYCGHCDGYGFVQKECVEDIVKEAPTIEPPTWISCAERLPEIETPVLICRDGVCVVSERINKGWLKDEYWRGPGDSTCFAIAPIIGKHYWMPLPNPPKGDE